MLAGRVALVSGAGHGIGRSHALELARLGAAVVVNDLGTSVTGEGAGRDADVVVAKIQDRGGRAVADYGDVSDEDAADAMVQRAVDEFGRLDVVVNNAGIVRDRAIWNMPVDDFDAVMRVHVRGTWLVSRAATRYWRQVSKDEGRRLDARLINTTSGAGLSGLFGQTNYATAKAAIVGMTLTLSLELARIGVTVNAIGPSGLTRISSTMPGAPPPVEPDERDPDTFDPKDPSLSSPLVAWLASDRSSHVSGQVIKAVGEDIRLMRGWEDGPSIHCGGERWQAETLAERMDTDIFGTRAPGLRLGG